MLFGLMYVVLVLVGPQAGAFWERNRLHRKTRDSLIPSRLEENNMPRMATQRNVFRINCAMIPDSMVIAHNSS